MTMQHTARAALALACAVAAASAATLDLHLLPTTLYSTALCNDGSPAGYYYKASPNASSLDWLVFQEGGGWCWDSATCLARAASSPQLTSSKHWAATTTQGGIFASDDARLSQLNLVFVPYCSSDGWAGLAGPASNPLGWSFRGHDIVEAVIADLVATQGLGAKAGTAVLAPACYKHCNTQSPTFSTLETNGVSLEMAVSSWFYGTRAVPQFVVEDCAGFNCGTDCPAV